MHKRGSKFFIEFTEGNELKQEKSKGRSSALLEKRNEKICYRFYYHSRILLLRYEYVLIALTNEFDLSEWTLIEIIAKYANQLKAISDRKFTRAQLKSVYPFFSWTERANVPKPIKHKKGYELKG